jgi:sugar phosphate isomerase/epimerase
MNKLECDRDKRKLLQAASASLSLAALPSWVFAQRNGSRIAGVQVGVQTYSFHDIPNDGENHVDWIIRNMQTCGLFSCELFAQQIAPGVLTGKRPPASVCPDPMLGCPAGKGGSLRNPWKWVFASYAGDELELARERQKDWNETVSMEFFRDVRRRMNDAGIDIYAYNVMLPPDATDLELDRFFESATTLGARSLNVSTHFSMLQRLAPFAERHELAIAVHGHGVTWDPEEFSTTATFERGFELSPWVRANLDVGHFAATGEDPVAFIEKHHNRIANLHLKDRRLNGSNRREEDGASVPWGKGDTPLRRVLLLLKEKRYPIPAFIEYEHAGSEEPVAEVRKAYEFCKTILA